MAKKNNAKSAGGGNAAAKTEKKGKNQISQQQARAKKPAARASAKISPAPEGPAPAISVLVPICNSEQYLEQALDSLIAQTFTDFEALCINDGSTDGSLDIIKRYMEKDQRFRLIDKDNSGYGASMNWASTPHVASTSAFWSPTISSSRMRWSCCMAW